MGQHGPLVRKTKPARIGANSHGMGSPPHLMMLMTIKTMMGVSTIHHQHHHNFYLGELQGSEFLAHSKRMQKIMSTAGRRSSSRMQIAAVEFPAHSKRMHNIMSTAGYRSSSRMQIAAVS